MSSVMIYFDSHMMGALKREEQYTITDFLAGTLQNNIAYSSTNFYDMYFYSS